MVLNTRSSVSNGADPLGGNVTCANVSLCLFSLSLRHGSCDFASFHSVRNKRQEKGKEFSQNSTRQIAMDALILVLVVVVVVVVVQN